MKILITLLFMFTCFSVFSQTQFEINQEARDSYEKSDNAIFMGMLNDQKNRTNGIGADLVVRPSNASFMNGVSGAPMPARIVEVFRRMPHVAVASPVITNFSMTGSVEILYGIDYASYNALKPFTWVAGGPLRSRMT